MRNANGPQVAPEAVTSRTDGHRGHDLVILPGQVQHAEALAAALRAADRAECEAVVGAEHVVRAIRESYEHSLWSWTACEPAGPVVCAWGVRPISMLGSVGMPWLLTGEAVERHWRTFARASLWWRDAMLDDFATLTNHCDARYAASLRWAAWLGFTVGEPVPYGGGLFRPLTLRRPIAPGGMSPRHDRLRGA